jgi:hypothetical protein
MLLKEELDKKVNTIMKSVNQILLNLLFNYENIEEISCDFAKNLTKTIPPQKMTGKKVDVDLLKQFHSQSLSDICIRNSLITNKKKDLMKVTRIY